MDSRIETLVKAAISLKATITSMKVMEMSAVRFLMWRGTVLIISAFVIR